MAKFVLAIDPDKCTGCGVCEIACSMEKAGECNPKISRIRIEKEEERGIDLPIVCKQCEDPPCIKACNQAGVDAISKDAETLLVLISEEKCIGCYTCVVFCPFGAISIDPKTQKAIICDLCGGKPKCVDFCSTGAIQYVKAELIPKLKRQAVLGFALEKLQAVSKDE